MSCKASPICWAASPTPFAACIVSIIFAASSRIRSSMFSIGLPLARRIGSPYSKIWQDHFSSRVNAGKFLTPASFNASMTLIIVPKEAFLSACSASVDLRGLRQITHGAFQFIHADCSSVQFDLVILIDAYDSVFSSEGCFFAVLDSGRLI